MHQISVKPPSHFEYIYIYVVVVTWARVICLKYTHEHKGCISGKSQVPMRPRAHAYVSGKSLVPMLQLIYSAWVTHLQVYMETAGMLCKCIYMGPCDFRLWIML